ncbi:DNA-binding protein [Candidatus Desantisbacteria bacterium CG_4_10_14_0_8_um_filter_48_22]|uniref:DNA-binding protein n=1 Tax=Candidatus Desantisbacteria bacterium CG_4_10_14_0_8_um_filter_48_22 TaxID=1974543 RepID=A0A2M7SD73_9BACT|nr:MAG: DNA-binding protein [Candidatus Desantisbacteria bacterium CG1_02_49_89]PIV55107.1 MAG: DNA-binding protein [Candidatus Desantisbacteria bacterium CG02_land_8_20_14_3_00_49_13]PIZ17468.1 MAG: DNA-binding protein [Candidatus Desantisbacteria bacterium CG_4_10_14_0_8_um_filter_48_22]
MKAIIPQEIIEQKIFMIRGHKVIFDRDLAMLYGVPTKVFNQAVKRNKQRFPKDFMFQLSKTELENWRSQFVTSNSSAKMGLRRPPYVFTEQGVAMLSSVLNSERAIQVNIAIMRAFVKLKEMLSTHKELAFKLRELERKIEKHDEEITDIFNAIRQMMIVEEKPKKQIGFKVD